MFKRLLFIAVSFVFYESGFAYYSNDYAYLLLYKDKENLNYTQKGFQLGSFRVRPRLDLGEEYGSNVYKQDSHYYPIYDSFVSHLRPNADILSDWNRHLLNFQINTDFASFNTQPDRNNYNDLRSRVDSRIDLMRNSFFDVGVAYNNSHEDRSSPDQIFGLTPTVFNEKTLDIFYNHRFNRVSIRPGILTGIYSYKDIPALDGHMLYMSTRDSVQYIPSIQIGYQIQPKYELFFRLIKKDIFYKYLVESNLQGLKYNRNSTGYNLLSGIAFDFTDLITANLSLGYLQRHYIDDHLPAISGVNGFLSVRWFPTKLTTVKAMVARDIDETTQAGVSGIFVTNFHLLLEHELLRNLIIKLNLKTTYNDFKGFDSDFYSDNRTDLTLASGISAKYLVNRNFSLSASYLNEGRTSNYTASDYDYNQLMFSVSFKL